ncbi:MAG: 1-acyl-sn-glycerol-3-phosphate acyltransferase [Pseudonocardiales bacterium]|nr:1-acyl-sn-glycerol-3-phosphate acyltransferase [Pseudonocardiales bacterium]
MTLEVPEGTWLWLQGFTRWIGTWCFYLGYRLRIWHRERVPATGAVVVVANHSAMVDGPLLYGLLGRRTAFLIKEEMFRGPLGWILPRIGQLPVRRGEADRAPLLTAVRLLRDDGVVVVFPEGTRGDGTVRDAQQGAAWLARTGGATMLPVAIRGTRRPAGSHRRFRPRVDVLVGEPFAVPPGKGRAALVTATHEVRNRLAALVTELDAIRRRGGANVARGQGA